MTALARSTPRLSAVPASQNTAPVAEFRCLFTHDVRRKQKRWQDGFLKFHSFNNRVMVYDTSRNFLGDTYWKESSELQEGDELALDKGVMVEVAEAMGVSQTDLTPLFDKKRDSPQGKTPLAAPSKLPPRPSASLSSVVRNTPQPRHKSLNTLLGKPRGPIGKAVPIQSPYDTRRDKENEWPVERQAKRQKTAHIPVPLLTSSPANDLSGPSEEASPPQAGSRSAAAKRSIAVPKSLPRGATVITLDSDPDHFGSDVTVPSPPNHRTKALPAPVSKPNIRREAPAPKTPKIPKGKVPVPHVKALQTPKPHPRPSSPPVSISNRLSDIDTTTPIAVPQKEPSPVPPPQREPKARALRLASGTKRGVLLCQSLPQEQRRVASELHRGTARNRKETRQEGAELAAFEATWPSDDDDPLVRADQDGSRPVVTKQKRRAQCRKAEQPSSRKKAKAKEPSPPSSPDAFEDMETIHGMMDQQLIVPSPPPKQVDSTKNIPISVPKGKPITAKKRHEKHAQIETTSEERSASSKRPRDIVCSPMDVVHTVTAPDNPSKEPSPEVRDNSNIASPRKPPISAGSLRKKPKKIPAAPTTAQDPTPDMTVLPSKHTTPNLPPHPLRASKQPPLMTTTELSRALLQHPPKSIAPDEDPIEDASQATNPSPAKKKSRSQSENDAPIPSTSAEWEDRNLRKATAGTDAATSGARASAKGGLAALVRKTDPRKKFVRTQSLSVETNIARGASVEVEIVSPPVDTDVGPWSTEAFDLFDWRPPVKEGEDAGIGLLVDRA